MLQDILSNSRQAAITRASKPRTFSNAHSHRSACSSASSVRSSINRAETTISALKYRERTRLTDLDETASIASSYWDTDLEDSLSDEEKKPPGEDKGGEQETYLKVCDKLGIIPVTRFGDQIGQDKVKVTHRYVQELGAKAMASVLLGNNTTTKVHLGDNAIGGKGGAYMGQVIQRNASLTEMVLCNNNLKRDGVLAITKALKTNTTMRRLDLSGNGLGDKDARILSDAIENNSTLRYLNLSYNMLAELSGKYFGSALSLNNGLFELDLSWNHIRRSGAASICDSLRYNDTLERLDLSWNGFDDNGTENLGAALKRNTSLVELALNNNRLSDLGIQNVAQGVEGNTTLEVLDISKNPVFNSCHGLLKIFEAVQKDRCALIKLNITDIFLDNTCMVSLEKLKGAKLDFKVLHGCKKSDEFVAKKEETNPLELLKDYMEKNKIHSSDFFKRLDRNGQFQDSMTRKDFIEGMQRLKIMNDYYLEKLVDILDTNGDGEIDYSEFASQR